MTGAAQMLTVRAPLAIRKRGGRKLVVAPEEAAAGVLSGPRVDKTLVKALARAHRWKRLLESGRFSSVAELAAAEKINQSFVCRMLRLTLLAPTIVEAVLDGRQPPAMQAHELLKLLPIEWEKQVQRVFARGSRHPEHWVRIPRLPGVA